MNTVVDQYFASRVQWKAELMYLRKILQSFSSFQETIKWGKACYSILNKNVVMIQDFKNYCALGFFNGASIEDPYNILIKPGAHTILGRQMRFLNIEEMKAKHQLIHHYLQQAIEFEERGVKVKKPKEPVELYPIELVNRLAVDKKLEKAFLSLTPGRQRAYQIFFSGSDQTTTRERRIDKMIPLILCGKGMNDCTCGLSKRMPNCDGSHRLLKK